MISNVYLADNFIIYFHVFAALGIDIGPTPMITMSRQHIVIG